MLAFKSLVVPFPVVMPGSLFVTIRYCVLTLLKRGDAMIGAPHDTADDGSPPELTISHNSPEDGTVEVAC